MLALASAQPYHTSRPATQTWRGKDKQPMRNQTISRPQSGSAASSSTSPRPHLSFRRSMPASSRRTAARESTEALAANQESANVAGPSQPRLPMTQPSRPTVQASTPPPSPPVLDIVNHPSTDLLKLLAALLQQIATANDSLRESNGHRSVPHPHAHTDSSSTNGENSMFSASHLSPSAHHRSTALFHARNIPTISIESYLLRILKYCPTTNEVFLSLLVYFDRMSKGTAEHPGMAIDSYNVHRLIIAGITVASKFFSDVFYLNSRYAKVGGLPQAELNQLELQFLLLNDFHLLVQPEELQRYANQLLVYSTTLHPPSPTAPLPPPLATSVAVKGTAVAPSDTLPTPSASPQAHNDPYMRHAAPADPPQPPLPAEFAHSRVGPYEEAEEGSGYGTTDDEPTIRPSDSSGSSIHTVSSTATSQATTPATSPTRRAMARLSSQSSTSSASSGYPHVQEMDDDGDEDADTDGEGDDTDDESLYRAGGGRRVTPTSPMLSPGYGRRTSTNDDSAMGSP